MATYLLIIVVLFIAYVNGANDNFKGVATLFGSWTTDYSRALGWATLTTLAGSITSLAVGAALARSFSGKGLVPDAITLDPHFLIAVGGGAALTVPFYLPCRAARKALGVEKETCLCIGDQTEVVDLLPDGTGVLRSTGVTLQVGEMVPCRTRYSGDLLGVSAEQALASLHFLSAGAVGFARG